MDDYTAISALQHYAYCPRQFALIHIEQVWAENRFTAEGQLLHERVDSGESESRKNVRFERSVQLMSHEYRIKGKMDLLEIETGSPQKLVPVEYKRGKPKVENWDRVQLCAQALCLEEMRELPVSEGAIWYWEVRKREPVVINDELREQTLKVISSARRLLEQGKTPLPTEHETRCRACSLNEICQPQVFRRDQTSSYIAEIGT